MVASFNAAQIDSFNGPNHKIILFLSSFQKNIYEIILLSCHFVCEDEYDHVALK